MSVKLRDGKSYSGTLVKYPTDHYIEGHPKNPIKIVNIEDYIWKKTEQEPIALGGSIDGYITFLFPGLLRDQVGDLDSILTLVWKDARGNSYNFDYKIPAQKSIIDFTPRPKSSPMSPPKPTPRANNPTVGNISQGVGSIAQVGGTGNMASVTNNFSPPQRHLTAEQSSQLITILSKDGPFDVTLEPAIGNLEAQTFADDFKSVFTKSSWRVADPAWIIAGQVPGLIIMVDDPDHPPQGAQMLAQALLNAGIKVSGMKHPLPKLPEGQFLFYVGVQPTEKRSN